MRFYIHSNPPYTITTAIETIIKAELDYNLPIIYCSTKTIVKSSTNPNIILSVRKKTASDIQLQPSRRMNEKHRRLLNHCLINPEAEKHIIYIMFKNAFRI